MNLFLETCVIFSNLGVVFFDDDLKGEYFSLHPHKRIEKNADLFG